MVEYADILSEIDKASEIRRYVSFEAIDRGELNKAVEKLNSNLNKYSTLFDDLDSIKFSFYVDGDGSEFGVEGIKARINFKHTSGYEDSTLLEIEKGDYEKFKTDFEDLIEHIDKGISMVYALNQRVKENQINNGARVSIQYRWSCNPGFCSINYWDYDSILVKLSKHSVSYLISNSNYLDSLVSETNFSMTIKSFIESFNSMHIHKEMGAILSSSDIKKALMENMLNYNEVMAVVKKNRNLKGNQVIKSAEIIKELGLFALACEWNVNYDNKSINVRLMDSKAYDIDNDKIVSDYNIIRRLENKLGISEEYLNLIFNS